MPVTSSKVGRDPCSLQPQSKPAPKAPFSPPPEIVAGFMAKEAEQALVAWNPLIAEVIKRRGLFGAAPRVISPDVANHPSSLRERMLRFLRRNFFDYFGRR